MSYKGCSLRKGRFSESKRPYLVTTVTDKRQRIFDNFELARLMIRQLRTNCDELDVDSLAWVVMPDHLHWLFVLNQHSISEVIKRVKGKSAYSINLHRGCHTKVWQHGFHDHAVRKEEDIKHIARYIIAIPLRAGL